MKRIKVILIFFVGSFLFLLLASLLLMYVWSFNPPLWNVLDLVIVPFVLAVGVYWLNRMQRKNELEIETRREQETILDNYFDRMTELILERGLGKSEPEHLLDQYLGGAVERFLALDLDSAKEEELNNEVSSEVEIENKVGTIARTLTLTTLRRLNGERKRKLLEFLYEAKLLTVKEKPFGPTLDMRDADLTMIDLSNAFLEGVVLSGADLSGADLSHAELLGADFSFTKLIGAKFDKATLSKIDLYSADLSKANLVEANLFDVEFEEKNIIYDAKTKWPKNFTPPQKNQS